MLGRRFAMDTPANMPTVADIVRHHGRTRPDRVALYFEGDDPAALGFDRTPAILTNFEVSQPMHAGRT